MMVPDFNSALAELLATASTAKGTSMSNVEKANAALAKGDTSDAALFERAVQELASDLIAKDATLTRERAVSRALETPEGRRFYAARYTARRSRAA